LPAPFFGAYPGDPDPTKKEMTLLDVPGPQLMAPHSTMRDFQNALENVRPSVGPDDLKQQEEFTKNFGMEG
jgi:SpoVK/Ycf46/Vps4 family AAA+-type ATPase